MQIMS